MKVTAIIVAGGVGSRMKAGINKVFLPLGGRTVIEHTVQTFLDAESVNEIVIVTRRDDISLCEKLFCRAEKNIKITEGGDTRQKSVYCGLKKAENEIAAIHDAVRALIDKRDIEKSICACEKYGAAALGISCVDSLKRADDDGFISETIDRTGVYRIQTPQTFFLKDIKYAHERALQDGFDAADDCALYEKYAGKVKIVEGNASNIKITFPEDLLFAEAILKRRGGVL